MYATLRCDRTDGELKAFTTRKTLTNLGESKQGDQISILSQKMFLLRATEKIYELKHDFGHKVSPIRLSGRRLPQRVLNEREELRVGT